MKLVYSRVGGPLLLALFAVTSQPRAAGKLGHVATVPQPPADMVFRANPAAAWEAVTSETKLMPGVMLKTAAREALIVLVDGTTLQAGPNSTLQLHASTEINLDPGRSTRVARVDLSAGSYEAAIPAAGRPLLAMASKEIFAALRPGKGRLRVTPEAFLVAVDQGGAKVAASGKWTALAEGQYQLLRMRGAQEGPKPLPPKPTFVAEPCHATASQACAIAVVGPEGRASLGARWQPASTSYRYIVELLGPNGEVLQKQEVPGDQPSFRAEGLSVGAYSLALTAVATEGIEGTKVLRTMHVVRLLPELGVAYLPREQLFVCPPGRKVKIDGGKGLQLAFGQDYGAVPPALDLVGDGSRTVRFRVEGDTTDDAAVILERSSLRAEVDLSPTTARWPKDPVRIAVKVSDPRRRVDPRNVRPRLRVRINDVPLQVGLTKVGDLWRGEIPPRNGAGPWAIRVEALDPDDNVLGRGVLNVLGKEARSRGLW